MKGANKLLDILYLNLNYWAVYMFVTRSILSHIIDPSLPSSLRTYYRLVVLRYVTSLDFAQLSFPV